MEKALWQVTCIYLAYTACLKKRAYLLFALGVIQIWRKGVPFGSLVQKLSTPTLQPPEI